MRINLFIISEKWYERKYNLIKKKVHDNSEYISLFNTLGKTIFTATEIDTQQTVK